MIHAVPWGVRTHLQLPSIESIRDGQYQGGREGDADPEGVPRAPGVFTPRVFKEKRQASKQTDHDAGQQYKDEDFEHRKGQLE